MALHRRVPVAIFHAVRHHKPKVLRVHGEIRHAPAISAKHRFPKQARIVRPSPTVDDDVPPALTVKHGVRHPHAVRTDSERVGPPPVQVDGVNQGQQLGSAPIPGLRGIFFLAGARDIPNPVRADACKQRRRHSQPANSRNPIQSHHLLTLAETRSPSLAHSGVQRVQKQPSQNRQSQSSRFQEGHNHAPMPAAASTSVRRTT